MTNFQFLFNDPLLLKESDGARMERNRHPFIGILQEDGLELHVDGIQLWFMIEDGLQNLIG